MAGFQLIAYEKLIAHIDIAVKELLKHHRLDPLKLEESIDKLEKERRINVKLLLRIISILQDSPGEEALKSKILNAAVYYIREQIGDSYNYTNPKASVFYIQLSSALEFETLNKDCPPNDAALTIMYESLNRFFQLCVYVHGDPFQGYLMSQPLSAKQIPGYIVEDDIKMLSKRVFDIKMSKINEELKKHKKENKSQDNNSAGLLSMFSKPSKPEAHENPITFNFLVNQG